MPCASRGPSPAATGSSSSRASTTASTTTRSSRRTRRPSSATGTTRSASCAAAASPRSSPTTVIPVPFNDLDALRRVFERDGEHDRGRHRRAHPGQRPGAPATARLPGGRPGADQRVRRAAHLRRGQDRLPPGARRGRRAVRRDAGPCHVCQGDGQRLSGGRLRWSSGRDEPAARARQPWRHVRREPHRGGGGRGHAAHPARHGRPGRHRWHRPAAAGRPRTRS